MNPGDDYLYPKTFFRAIALPEAVKKGRVSSSVRAPPEARGMFLGLWRLTGQGGATLSPILFAVIAETMGYGSRSCSPPSRARWGRSC
jgi:MFS-type transporter involved in bile tolerance (Atg22 family)